MIRLLPLLVALPLASTAVGPQETLPDELRPLPGSVVLAGEGAPSDAVRSAFVDLAGGGAARIAVIAGDRGASERIDWRAAGARAQDVVLAKRAKDLTDEDALATLLVADGLWLEGLPDKVVDAPLVRALIQNALERGAVVGASGELARRLTGVPGVDEDRLGVVPRVELLAAPPGGDEDAAQRAAGDLPARIVVAVPEGAALAIHRGRRIALLGEGDVALAIKRADGTLVREQVLEGRERRDSGDPLGYRLDLLSWIRSARGAERSPFPPEAPRAPRLAAGALIVQGGGGVSDATWEQFIELAGGRDAAIVCIPSAGEMDDDRDPSSYSARELEQSGCSSVGILHVGDRRVASIDPVVLERIDAADAVWIDGGRTYRFMDRFGETPAADALARVLERGGVVGGSSAGAQVIGELLVRGNPKSNADLTDPGYLEGLGLLPGVVVDAHFRDRDRGAQLAALVGETPQMLGLGIDAGTALLVRGSVAEVLGEAGVVVFDRRDGRDGPDEGRVLESGSRFDLVQGTVLD